MHDCIWKVLNIVVEMNALKFCILEYMYTSHHTQFSSLAVCSLDKTLLPGHAGLLRPCCASLSRVGMCLL